MQRIRCSGRTRKSETVCCERSERQECIFGCDVRGLVSPRQAVDVDAAFSFGGWMLGERRLGSSAQRSGWRSRASAGRSVYARGGRPAAMDGRRNRPYGGSAGAVSKLGRHPPRRLRGAVGWRWSQPAGRRVAVRSKALGCEGRSGAGALGTVRSVSGDAQRRAVGATPSVGRRRRWSGQGFGVCACSSGRSEWPGRRRRLGARRAS